MKTTMTPVIAAMLLAILSPASAAPSPQQSVTIPAFAPVPSGLKAKARSSYPLPYPEGPLKYRAPVVAGGPNLEFTGTAQQIHAQIRSINPSYKPKRYQAPGPFDKRTISGTPNCEPFGPGQQSALFDSPFNYLTSMGDGQCSVDAQTCVRVSCDGNAAVYLCNDNAAAISEPCATISVYGSEIRDACTGTDGRTHGQLFDTDGFNVILTDWDCSTDSHLGPGGVKPPVPSVSFVPLPLPTGTGVATTLVPIATGTVGGTGPVDGEDPAVVDDVFVDMEQLS